MIELRPLADAVDKVARHSAGKDWGLFATLLGHWADIVGSEYAQNTTPIKITFPYQPHEAQRKKGTLTIRLPKGLAMEFSFKADLIRRRINTYLGYEAFTRILLDAAAVPPPHVKKEKKEVDPEKRAAIKECASSIDHDDLRVALERFGEAILTEKS
ncbi:MAG: DciA family protein [Alphaproteobacteria bacterium]|nr:DciA family protein [Alphaproteobacteria bacterium]